MSLGTPSYSDRPLIVGILNVTPNSFSDAYRYIDSEAARRRALEMIEQGVDLIDLGGEASSPGSIPISVDEELSRVIPVIRAIREASDVCISIDTCKAIVMKETVDAGASMINDILALTGKDSLATAKALNVPVCLMHMKGTPQTMQDSPFYEDDIVTEINNFFCERIQSCIDAGIAKKCIILDPGIGFGKSLAHNLQILKRISVFNIHKQPLLLGVSRKNMIGEVLRKAISERMIGGVAIAIYAWMQGVRLIRTHDVDETKQAFSMVDAILSSSNFQVQT